MISSSQIYLDHTAISDHIDIVDRSPGASGTLLGISDDQLLTISAREVGQIAADLPSEQVKALKQRRRTLKNREYAGMLITEHAST